MKLDITYPSHISWRVDVTTLQEANDLFRSSLQKKMRRSRAKFEEAGYRFAVEDLTPALLDQFFPLYKAHIETKENAIVHDLKQRIIEEPTHSFPYGMVNFYAPDNTYLGGLIFSNREHGIHIGYKYFPFEVDGVSVEVGAAYMADLWLTEYALEQKKQYITRGRDRNAYGYGAAIGLALYKLRVGYQPWMHIPERYDLVDGFEWDEKNPLLLFIGDTPEVPIAKAKLWVPDDKDYTYITSVLDQCNDLSYEVARQ